MTSLIRGACLAGGAIFLLGAARGPQSRDDSIQTGLQLWRTPDKLGRACASCHSPDGIELARYGFDEATIRRRATPHLGAEAAEKLATYVVSLRSRLKASATLDPMVDRPMQPGGKVLAGDTARARDKTFILTLGKYLPALAGGRIASLEEAQAALSQVLAIDPQKVEIGIPLNRLSEDTFRGKEHATLAHWIPDVAPIPYSADLEKAQLDYLANPSNSNLMAIDKVYAKGWSMQLQPIAALSLEKARCLLRLQHLMRTGVLIDDLPAIPDPRKPPTNPFWEVGELARFYSNSQASMLGLPQDLLANKSGGPSFSQQFHDMRVPWMWIGWMADPGLQRTSFDKRTRYADWFSEFLLEDGPYPGHAAFMLTKKIAAEAYDREGWGSVEPQHLDLNYSWILRNENWRQFADGDPVYRLALYGFLANAFRMYAFLQASELRRTGVTFLREPVVQQLTYMKTAAATMDPEHAREDADIFDQAILAVKRARLVS